MPSPLSIASLPRRRATAARIRATAGGLAGAIVLGVILTAPGCRSATALSPANVATAEVLAQAAAQVTALEREKVQLAFGTSTRTPDDVARFLAMFAPEFRSINLGPTGVTQTGAAENAALIATFPAMPYTLGNVRAIAINAQGVVVSYEVVLQMPGAAVRYVASSTWARDATGAWRTIFHQATPL